MTNKKTVFKVFLKHEKEKEYLNQMNKKGWKLVSIRFAFYTFVKTKPDEYMTVCHFADRQYQTTFIRTITECGCEVAHQTNSGKYILFYINVPVGSEKADFLTDNQSKLDSQKRFVELYRREFITLFAIIPFSLIPSLMSLPVTVRIFRTAPDDPYSLMKEYMFGYIGNAVCIVGGILCGVMGVYVLYLYLRTKREIKNMSNEMNIYE